MDSPYITTVRLLAKAKLGYVIAFYDYIITKRVVEIGSSSMNPTLAKSCTEIRELMRREFQIVQYNEQLNVILTLMGDPSATLFFGGKQYLRTTNDWRRISAREYIELLASKLHNLSQQAQTDLELIAQDSVLMSQAPRTPITFTDKQHKNG